MSSQMGFEITTQGEFFVALIALVRLLACMKEHVVFQVGYFTESPVTDGTSVGPRPVVNVLVGFEVTGSWKTFAAESTFVRLFLEIRK